MEHDLKICWNFFATSHGKGVVDGIGSTLKRAVWRHVKAERAHVTNPSQYADLGKQLCPNIRIEFVSKEDIAQYTSFLDEKWENTKAVPGTHQVHCVRADGSDFVEVSDTTDSRFISARTRTKMKMANAPPQMLLMWRLDSGLWLHMMGSNILGRLLIFLILRGWK